MPNSLLTGVSGLVAHQRMLDVVGNNLANINTTAYKVQRSLFSDLLYETISTASDSAGDTGGTNPKQIGSGVRLQQVDREFGQGNLELTGGLFDFAIQGDGLFVLDDGTGVRYARAGAFGLDKSNVLVDPSSGFRVQRFGTVGEGDGAKLGFQTAGDSSIQIPFGTLIPGEETTTASLIGNLDANLSQAVAEVFTSATPYTAGGAAATAATSLNSLDSNTSPYAAGDSIAITGTDVDGSIINSSFAVDASTTMGDLVTAISGAYTGATASIDASGNLVLTADNPGEASLSLALGDAAGNAGATSFSNHSQVATIHGSDADTVTRDVEVFDVQGGAHLLQLTFTKQADSVWDVAASIDPSEGTLIDGAIQQIVFSDDGSLQQVLGTGTGDTDMIVKFAGIATPQTIQFNLGTGNSFNGLTHLVTDSSLSAVQDGFAAGTLNSISVGPDGILSGVASNGRIVPIAQLAIATFRNTKGLTSLGDNFYEQSLNSGEAQVGAATTGGRGFINGGQLESSNVDIAFEFTRLIVAQRGFSANARTITISDEVLEELTNIVR